MFEKMKKRLIPSKTELFLALGILMATPTGLASNNPEKIEKKPNYAELLEKLQENGKQAEEVIINYVKNRKIITENQGEDSEVIFTRKGYEVKAYEVKDEDPSRDGNIVVLLDKQGKAVQVEFQTFDGKITKVDQGADGRLDRIIINRSNKSPSDRRKVNNQLANANGASALKDHAVNRTYMGITIMDITVSKEGSKFEQITFDELQKPDIQESTGTEGEEDVSKLQISFVDKLNAAAKTIKAQPKQAAETASIEK